MKPIFGWVGLLLAIYFLAVPQVQAQNTIRIIDQDIRSRFRVSITAELSAQHSAEITDVEFFYRVVGRRVTSRNLADFEPGLDVEAQFNINQRMNYFPPGTEIEYWWRLADVDGNVLKTEPQSYIYLDNRFDFKTIANDRISLYWYNGNQTFGQALFNQAVKGLDRLETDIGVTIDQPIKVFIYGNHTDLLEALSVGAREWTGGVAFSEQGVVLIGIDPVNLDWGLSAMTHELTHLVIHQATDNPYGGLPTWLNEGIAVYNESPDQLHTSYQEVIDQAMANNSLFTLRSLTSSFPADPEAAHLAYGQSGAMVHFLIDTYGPEAMSHLLEIFSEGSLPDKALVEALGEDTWSLDNAFRESQGLAALPPLPGNQGKRTETQDIVEDVAPNSSDLPETVPQSSEPVPEAAASSDTTSSAAKRAGRSLGCFGGLLAFGAIGLTVTRRRPDFVS